MPGAGSLTLAAIYVVASIALLVVPASRARTSG